MLKIAQGETGRVADHINAGKLVLELARFQSGPSGALSGLPGNLAELPLEDLESVLAGTLDHVRNLRAIESTSQVIDSPAEDVPTSGTHAADATPPEAPAQAALPLQGVAAGPAPAPPPEK